MSNGGRSDVVNITLKELDPSSFSGLAELKLNCCYIYLLENKDKSIYLQSDTRFMRVFSISARILSKCQKNGCNGVAS